MPTLWTRRRSSKGSPGTGPGRDGALQTGDRPYNANVRKYPYDPQKARKLLAEAGWRDTDGDGVLDRDGKPFVFEILSNQGHEVRAKCAEIIQRRLAEVGIRVKIRIVEWAAFVNDFINKRKFDATILAGRFRRIRTSTTCGTLPGRGPRS